MSTIADYNEVTGSLYKNPYDPFLFLQRSKIYHDLRYPDLAAIDAYLCVLLLDDIEEPSGEHHDEALQAFSVHFPNVESGLKSCQKDVFRLLSTSLSQCGCFKTALQYCRMGLDNCADDEVLLHGAAHIEAAWKLWLDGRDADEVSDMGIARREVYPWNTHEPDRFSDENLTALNNQLTAVNPDLEVRVTELPDLKSKGTSKQLGLFAKREFAVGETVLKERSLLTANNRIKEPLCDACSSPLQHGIVSSRIQTCTDCTDVYFCDETCYELAMEKYHPTLCDRDIDELGKEPKPKGKDINNALYFLLLLRVIALSNTQETHPLELSELKYIWGDFHPSPEPLVFDSTNPFFAPKPAAPNLPFSWEYDLILPLHALEKLDLPLLPFYDPWVLLTAVSKFRGTASARVSLGDGKPEVAAVHPLWCLANHSCCPNVTWEWGGVIEFVTAKEKLLPDGSTVEGRIEKGSEVWNHYCDIELNYKERREWARGALGGDCECPRCLYEEMVAIRSQN